MLRMRRVSSSSLIGLKLSPLSRETNSPSSVPMKIAPGTFGFVAIALILVRVASSPPRPALSLALGNLISLQPFFSSSVMNNPFHVEAIIHNGWDDWDGWDGWDDWDGWADCVD